MCDAQDRFERDRADLRLAREESNRVREERDFLLGVLERHASWLVADVRAGLDRMRSGT